MFCFKLAFVFNGFQNQFPHMVVEILDEILRDAHSMLFSEPLDLVNVDELWILLNFPIWCWRHATSPLLGVIR